MKISLSGNRIVAIVFLAVILVYGWGGSQLTASLQGDLIGPAFFPRVLTVLGIVLAALLVFKPAGAGKGKQADQGSDFTALVPAAMLLVYALVFEFLGFLLATPLFLVITFRYLGHPSWAGAAGYSFLVTAVLFGLFKYVLDIRLPLGLLSKLF